MEFMIDGNYVYQKQYDDKDKKHYNWTCIAEFHYHKGCMNPKTSVELFLTSLLKNKYYVK